MDLPFVAKGSCSCLNYLQAALLMAKAYHISIERIVTATERFQIIFALNFTTTDRQFLLFFSLGKIYSFFSIVLVQSPELVIAKILL